eukprot:894906_1
MSAPIEMEEHKTSQNNTSDAQAPGSMHSDCKFLDLGWGLESIGVPNPYRREWTTLIYTGLSFIISVLIILIPTFVPVLILAVIHVIAQCTVFLYCFCKYKSRSISRKKRNSIECNLSMSIDKPPLDSDAMGVMGRSGFMSPLLAAEYEFNINNEESPRRTSCTCSCLQTRRDFIASFDETFGREDDPI